MDPQTLELHRVYRWNKRIFIASASLLLVFILFVILAISQPSFVFVGLSEIVIIIGIIAFVGVVASGYALVKFKKLILQNDFTVKNLTQAAEGRNKAAGYSILFLGVIFTVISAIFIESRSLTIVFALLSAPVAITLFVLGFRVLKKQ